MAQFNMTSILIGEASPDVPLPQFEVIVVSLHTGQAIVSNGLNMKIGDVDTPVSIGSSLQAVPSRASTTVGMPLEQLDVKLV